MAARLSGSISQHAGSQFGGLIRGDDSDALPRPQAPAGRPTRLALLILDTYGAPLHTAA
jgi:hypothetical protein